MSIVSGSIAAKPAADPVGLHAPAGATAVPERNSDANLQVPTVGGMLLFQAVQHIVARDQVRVVEHRTVAGR